MYWSEFGFTKKAPPIAGHAKSSVAHAEMSAAQRSGRRGAISGVAGASVRAMNHAERKRNTAVVVISYDGE
jgi:hypothetical protein